MATEDARKPQGVSRRNFLVGAVAGAAGIVGIGRLAKLKGSGKPNTIWGLDEDSLFMPRPDQLERYLKNR